jgi:alpha-tubulin suppressor-like RCC1 family protein
VLYCWGRNDLGQLGIGSSISFVTEPTLVQSQLRFATIDGGATHTCALGVNDNAYCWGSNEYGEVGDGAQFRPGLAGPTRPSLVIQLGRARAVSAGTNHSCAIDNNLVTHCWGRGTYGQLGNGNTIDISVRQPVFLQPTRLNASDLLRLTRLAAGGHTHVCGIADGRPFCWGTGREGQLGTPLATFTTLPQRVRD